MRKVLPAAAAVLLAVAIAAAAPANERVLRILDQDGRPVPHVAVKLAGAQTSAVTDAEGRVALQVEEGTDPVAEFQDGVVQRTASLAAPVTDAVVKNLPWIEFEVIDGWTRAPCGRVPITVLECADRLDGRETVSGPTGGVRVAPSELGTCELVLRVGAPADRVGPERLEFGTMLAARARRARMTIAVYPFEKRTFRALDEGGRPVAGAVSGTVFAACFPEVTRRLFTGAAVPTDAEGLVPVERVPRIPLGRASLQFEDAPRDGDGRRTGLARFALDGAEPAAPQDVTLSALGKRPFRCGAPQFRPEAPPTVPVMVVRVLHRDGSAAAGVTVVAGRRQERTGVDGVARIEGVPLDVAAVFAADKGFLPTAAAADPDRRADVVIREAEPRTAHVEVVDEQGHPVPCAIVSAVSLAVPGPDGRPVDTGHSLGQFDGPSGDAVQVLLPTTGADGRIDVVVPQGRNRFCATAGSSFAFVETDADRARIVLRPKD